MRPRAKRSRRWPPDVAGSPAPTPGAPTDPPPDLSSRPFLAPRSMATQAADAREYSLFSLVELSRQLLTTRDVHDAADSLLLCLMGQIGTAHAALWLGSPNARPVLIRCHGMDAALARALGAACWSELGERFRAGATSLSPDGLQSGVGQSAQSLARRGRVALFAPLCSADEPLGIVALGSPVGQSGFTSLQLDVLEASLAIAGLAIRSAHLRSVALESGRSARRANEELRELDRMKSEFMARVNHELRTPIAVALGCLECLADKGIPQEEREPLLQNATQSTERMMSLVDRLLVFSETGGGSLAVRMSDADLSTYIVEYYEERSPGISAGFRELELDCDRVRRPVRLDPVRMRQVIDELIDNAAKFSPPGTRIRLHVGDRVEDGTTWAQVSVSDEGIGIPQDRLADLFQPFRQLDGSLTRKAGGLGIGLAMARQLIEAMGGCITVESEEGAGSTFVILLPAG